MKSGEEPFYRRALTLLSHGPFRRYLAGSFVSDTGTWMQQMAQAWVMSSLTNRALWLGAVYAASGLPTLLLSMYGGSVADRYDKRRILLITQFVQIAIACTLGVLAFMKIIAIWHIVLLASCLGVCIAFEMPAITALVPDLVKKEQIATAIALDRSTFHCARLLGPPVAGMLVGWIGAAAAFFANAFSFLALVAALASLPARIRGTAEEEEQRKSGFKEGLRYVRQDRIILCMIALIALVTVFIFPFLSVMLPLYVRNILHLGPDRMGLLMAISALGSLAGSLLLLGIKPGQRLRFMSIAAIVVAAALFCLSRLADFSLTAICMSVLAVALSLNFALAGTIVQERAPSPLRGRISAIFGLSFFGLQPIAGLVTPAFTDLVGMRTALMASSICFGIGAFFVLNFAGKKIDAGPRSKTPEMETVAAAAPAA